MIQAIIILVAIAFLVGAPLLYAFRSWRPGKKPPKDRIRLLATFLEVATLMIVIQMVITASNPMALWLWLTALVALAVGAAGATVRGRSLPWRDSERSSWSMISSGFGAVVCIALIGVLA